MANKMKRVRLTTKVLIIGGGTAGCYAAVTLRQHCDVPIIIVDKAAIKRSGCLAAGVNALNAYIVEGRKPEDYVDYATKDAAGIVRHDLLLTMSQHLNEVTADLESMGLVILKDEKGRYLARGNRNIKINGENIKPLLASAVRQLEDVTVLEHITITDYLTDGETVVGAVGFSLRTGKAYEIRADYVLCATGGASGLYRPNNPGFSRHKMWYSPFNTGAGYAMGMRAGAEMTTLEMRFIALRCKDTIAPTGTIAQGVGAKQVNSLGEVYETKYGLTTSQRLYGTVAENEAGRGPCYLDTTGITEQQNDDLLKAYLNMAPGQTLRWLESGATPKEQAVEIEGTEPYVVGGHTAGGYWVDTNRATTLQNLWAAGDVAGGCPQKYVTGALVEGKLAALDIVKKYVASQKMAGQLGNRVTTAGVVATDLPITTAINGDVSTDADSEIDRVISAKAGAIMDGYDSFLTNDKNDALYTVEQLEEAMQGIMDHYAGGIGTAYRFNEYMLKRAETEIKKLEPLVSSLVANDYRELMHIYELRERLTVCRGLLAHLRARKETRWHSFAEYAEYPEMDAQWDCYVNTVWRDGEPQVVIRPLVKGDTYEHTNQ